MSQQDTFDHLFQTFRTVGNAILRVNGNNTHSGNLSLKNPDDPHRFYATASGSQIGSLIPQDLVPLHFSEVSWGDGRATTESNIHRKVLSLPGVNACIHCHHLMSTTITFDTREKALFLRYPEARQQACEDAVFHPVDIHGANIIGGVTVGTYKQPVGSIEMEERIPQYLKNNALTLIRGHGLFAGGATLQNCLRYVSVLENSATLALNLVRLGVDLGPIQAKLMTQGPDSIFPSYPAYQEPGAASDNHHIGDAMVAEFAHWLAYVYNTMIGAYGTGSMSQKITANEMVFCPMSAVPAGMDFPLIRTPIDITDGDGFEISLHKSIYQQTNFTSCIMASNPLISAEGMAILAHAFGPRVLLGDAVDIPYGQKDHPVIVPIDAEAIYLNPRIGLVDGSQLDNRSADNPIFNMLNWHKGCCVVSGFGVVAVGDTTLEQAAHNVSSAERVAKFRTEVFLNQQLLDGPTVAYFEPKTL